jgi:site-specific DNA-methyltransferase (adenine-specific)
MVKDRVVELLRVRAGDLDANPRNWRRHPPRQRAVLRGLLREIGYADALLARRDHGSLVLIDGHLRKSLDPEQVVPVLVLDLTESEADTLLTTLDPLAGLALADPPALAELLARVQTTSQAVRDFLEGIARGAGLPATRLLADPDWAPPPPSKPKTKRGDLWSVGRHRLLCGDATDMKDLKRLMAGERVKVVWTDPPYGVGYTGKTPRALRIVNDRAADLDAFLQRAFASIDDVLAAGAAIYLCHPAGPLAATFVQAFSAQGWQLRQQLVWVKDAMVLGHADYHWRHEPILYGFAQGGGRRGRGGQGWYGGNAQTSVFELPRPKASREHPTMKPVELVRRCLLNSSKETDPVLDPFVGSGSTLVAAEISGRRGFACELDPAYCDVALARLEEITGETPSLKRKGSRGRR